MKRACLLLLPAMLLIVLAASGCNEESKPIFTRVSVTPSCGVLPLNVEVFAAVSGGNESGDPMGGNNNLEVTWDFGDNDGSATSSVAYHQYKKAGEFTINVVARDPDGQTTSASVMVVVNTDSLVITAGSTPPSGNITAGTQVQFELAAAACGIDFPTVAGDSVKMTYHWAIMSTDTTDYYGAQPMFTFLKAGDYDVDVAVTYPALAVTRHAKLHYTVGP